MTSGQKPWALWKYLRCRIVCTRGILLLAFFSISAHHGGATGATGPHGSVELIADRPSVQPGQSFWAGLYFQLEPGWHIYWTNPGDSGEPPRVKWNVPAGIQAGPLQWPTPRRIDDHSLTDYGYQNQVLLPAKVSLAVGTNVGPDVRLGATVNWLVCRDICIPGRALLALTLPVHPDGPPKASSAQHLFARTLANLPRPAPSSWRTTATLDRRQFVLNVDCGQRIAAATFFPFEPDQVENAALQKATPGPQGVRLEIPQSDQLLKAPAHLAGVLVIASGQGYVINAPVAASR